VWLEWGADLYSWKPEKTGVKSFVKTCIERRLRTKIFAMIGIFPPDCDVYKKTFPKSKAKVYYAPYSSANGSSQTQNKYELDSRLLHTKKDNDTVYIQVGHSAAPVLNHIDVLEDLKKFSKENIKIFLPLNYGNKDYADKVQKYAEQIFGDKLLCLREMMPKEEYFALLERIDIAVFNTHRQIALGNVNVMVFNNVKLYMPQNSVMYEFFTSQGAPIQKFEDLKHESFEQLSTPVFPENAEKFEKYLYERRDMKIIVDLWKKIYEDLENNLNKKYKGE
jgi:hypothetical protein